MHSIKKSIDIGSNTIEKNILKIISRIPETDSSSQKLGGRGFFIRIDEAMLNYKCKSHRGSSSVNRTDVLCKLK
ncbi:hypothetical protein H312_02761 [Anncaliia algerae PRA339]|uniref:Uncharacterized protein n=1 Tax=Anncaliia algerae PRA339 TaxID=1288291 RepID=A0A059EXS5_9MICR|nr:hypothetical protein H312_02761 [Anncaliia algerae PRA339]